MFKVKTTKETKNSPSCYTKGDVAREVLLLPRMLRLRLFLLWFMAFPHTSYYINVLREFLKTTFILFYTTFCYLRLSFAIYSVVEYRSCCSVLVTPLLASGFPRLMLFGLCVAGPGRSAAVGAALAFPALSGSQLESGLLSQFQPPQSPARQPCS